MFAVNFYQYVRQRACMDGQVAALEGLALALTQKHLALAQLPRPRMAGASNPGQSLAQRLKRINDRLSVRELDVCALVAGYDPVKGWPRFWASACPQSGPIATAPLRAWAATSCCPVAGPGLHESLARASTLPTPGQSD